MQSETPTPLKRVFIATNAEPSYLLELRAALVADGWAPEAIVMSTDLDLNWRGVSVGVAVDMSIMVRAEVFIGNGVRFRFCLIVTLVLTLGLVLVFKFVQQRCDEEVNNSKGCKEHKALVDVCDSHRSWSLTRPWFFFFLLFLIYWVSGSDG